MANHFKKYPHPVKRPFVSLSGSEHGHGKQAKLAYQTNNSCNDIQQQRQALPIFAVRNSLLKEIRRNLNLVVLGETACGKTTQIPQYIYEENIHRGKCIACTQPRRVAATTVARRVSEEMKVQIGTIAGYSVRFDDMTSEETKIKYMTDGMLLREAISDPMLRRYSVVILDEAHERTIHTDVLFGVVKQAQARRIENQTIPLRVIIMSATMDVDHFSAYFHNAPVVYIEGRQHDVKVLYTKSATSDYMADALTTVFQIHREEKLDEDILVFMTGQEEIEAAVSFIRRGTAFLPQGSPAIFACPMYASLHSGQQMKIFRPTPSGMRKVIVATNIAETSVTINGVVHVIDTGKVKSKVYNPGSGLEVLKVVNTSQAQAWQRSGRAGRERPGKCYRLFTEEHFLRMSLNPVPEILRCNLGSVCLQLMALGVRNVQNFDFMDKPAPEFFQRAFQELHLLGAVTQNNELTPLGRKMAQFPLDPKLSKVILSSSKYECLEEVLTVVALLSGESIFIVPPDKREEALAATKTFSSPDGDHIMYLNVYRNFKNVNSNKEWCTKHFIHYNNIKRTLQIREQLKTICTQLEMSSSACHRDTTSLRKCFTAGFFMDVAELQTEGKYLTVGTKKSVAIHPSSCLFQCKPSYVLYNELIETSKCYMRSLCTVDPDWLYEVAPSYFRNKLRRN